LTDLRSERADVAGSAKVVARLKSLAVFAVKLVFSGGMLLFVLRQVDLTALRETFVAMNWALLAAGLLQMLIIPLLGGVRWKFVLVAMRRKAIHGR
jgi:hypothetical protein